MSIRHLKINPVRGINDLIGKINHITKGGAAYVFHPHDQELFISKINLRLHFKSVDSCIKKSSGIIKLVGELYHKLEVSRPN